MPSKTATTDEPVLTAVYTKWQLLNATSAQELGTGTADPKTK